MFMFLAAGKGILVIYRQKIKGYLTILISQAILFYIDIEKWFSEWQSLTKCRTKWFARETTKIINEYVYSKKSEKALLVIIA